MRLSFVPLLLLPYLTSAARFHYNADRVGDNVEFTMTDYCTCLNNGYAKSMYWSQPGETYYAVAFKEDGKNCCGTERCNINGLHDATCCNSPNKDIKGAQRYSIEPIVTPPRRMARDKGCPSIWEHGALLNVAAGNRTIQVPNHNNTMPTENEIWDVLVNAGVEDVEVDVARVKAELEL
jgi:hypothetical protein